MSEKNLVGSLIVGQSGGPSSVINCSAYGVIKTGLENPNITKVYGAFHGIKGSCARRFPRKAPPKPKPPLSRNTCWMPPGKCP